MLKSKFPMLFLEIMRFMLKEKKRQNDVTVLCAQIYKDNLGTADSGSPWCKFYKNLL